MTIGIDLDDPIFDTPYLQIQIKSGFFMFCACVPIA